MAEYCMERVIVLKPGSSRESLEGMASIAAFGGMRATGVLLLFLSHVVAARAMDVSGYGSFVYLLTWMNLLALIGRLGLDTALMKHLPEARAGVSTAKTSTALTTAFRVPLVVSVCGSLLLCAALAAIQPTTVPDTMAPLVLAAATLPLLAISTVYEGALRGMERNFAATALVEIARPVLLILGLLVLSAQATQPTLLGALGASLFASSVVLGALIHEWRGVRGRLALEGSDPGIDLGFLKQSLPFLVLALSGVALSQTDILLVGSLLGAEAAGLYAAAARLVLMVSFGISTLTMLFGPKIAGLYAGRDWAGLQSLLRQLAWLSVGYTMVVVLLLVLMGSWALLLFGEDYEAAYPILLILLIGPAVNGLTGPVSVVANMCGLQRETQILFVAACFANVIVGMLFIQAWGAVGAACASALCLSLLHLALLRLCWTRLGLETTVLGRKRCSLAQARG